MTIDKDTSWLWKHVNDNLLIEDPLPYIVDNLLIKSMSSVDNR